MIDNVDGSNVAAVIPRTAREAISIAALVEKAVNTEAIVKTTAPASSNLLLPIRSPSVPIVISSPASKNPKISEIQSSSELPGLRSTLIAGIARYITVISIDTRSVGKANTANPIHAFRSAFKTLDTPDVETVSRIQ